MKIYVSENRLVLFTVCSAFVYTFLYFPFGGWSFYSLSTIACMSIVVVYVLVNLETVLNLYEYRGVNLLACVYSFSVLLSKAYNDSFSLLVLVTFGFKCSLLPFVEMQRVKGHIRFLYKIFLLWFGISLAINDLLMVAMPGRFYGDGITKVFFLGNKFSVGYDHIIFLIVFFLLYLNTARLRKWISILFFITCFVCIYINCRTVLLGTIVMFAVYSSPESVFHKLSRKRTTTIVIIICAMFVFFTQITSIPSVKYFITEVLGRDVTLTGRQQIFAVLPKVIKRKLLLGYGASSEIISKYTGAFDAQNGFFDLIVSNGLPSAILYAALIVSLVAKRNSKAGRILLGAVYAYLIMSMVEVTFGTTLVLFSILLMTEKPSYKEEDIRILEPQTRISVRLL